MINCILLPLKWDGEQAQNIEGLLPHVYVAPDIAQASWLCNDFTPHVCTVGSGKTAAFSLPILERLLYRPKRVAAIYALILTPTRELAVQVQPFVSFITTVDQFSGSKSDLHNPAWLHT